ncbi:hypothetical protein IWX50DRAFT_267166 [Phyllosticta citricarpa]|uniref:Uncharacterized protein n=1 Tax=Phyllosticta citricarpa TaxID=55181 RepID=A0ABR1LH32_9PEZI
MASWISRLPALLSSQKGTWTSPAPESGIARVPVARVDPASDKSPLFCCPLPSLWASDELAAMWLRYLIREVCVYDYSSCSVVIGPQAVVTIAELWELSVIAITVLEVCHSPGRIDRLGTIESTTFILHSHFLPTLCSALANHSSSPCSMKPPW